MKTYELFLWREPSVIQVKNINLAVLFQLNYDCDIRITFLAEFECLLEQGISS
jgi:hypothetical protein